MYPSDKPLEEDNVALRCKADKLIYTNLTWFLAANVSKSERDAPIQPCHSMTLQPVPVSQAVLPTQQGTNITLELMLPNASFQDEGLYACQVVNIKTGVKTCLLLRLSLRGSCFTHLLQTCRVLRGLTSVFLWLQISWLQEFAIILLTRK